jgi:alanine-alpha-ketoisovalerate/valine-pyruvate aminotransferase
VEPPTYIPVSQKYLVSLPIVHEFVPYLGVLEDGGVVSFLSCKQSIIIVGQTSVKLYVDFSILKIQEIICILVIVCVCVHMYVWIFSPEKN